MNRFKLSVLATGLALAGLAFNASACTTMIVGKDVSKTGNIIVGHNEDNGGRILTAQYWVPAATHKKGEMIKFEEAAAEIPQVEKTFGFYWSQTYNPKGASFSDGFVNENGVVIVSNNCSGIYDDDRMPLKDGGIGYGIRRLMAERATSARHAVDIAIDLLGEYGYFADGRTYTIADAKEAWQIAIHQGNTWVARRVKDNEVVFIPNNFMMDKVDATDKENVLVAPGMIERAIKNGRYKPAKDGVYNDFNYRVAVAPAARRAADFNYMRNHIGWKYIADLDITDPEKFPYSVTPNKKFGVEEVKEVLRLHEEGMNEQDPNWSHSTSLGICRATTHESAVYELNDNPLLIAGYRALSRPCETPFIPFFPLAQPDENLGLMTPDQATAEHFKGTIKYFNYKADWPVWTFINNANVHDFQRDDVKANFKFVKALEDQLGATLPDAAKEAARLLKISEDKAVAYLHEYNVRMARDGEVAMAKRLAEAAPYKITILADQIDPQSSETIDVVLFGDKTLDVSKVDPKKVWLGASRANVRNRILMADALGQATKVTFKDMNEDGQKDAVLTFTQKDVSKHLLAGAFHDVWFYGYVGDKRVAAKDTVKVVK